MDSALVAAAANELKAECERLREETRRLRQIPIDYDIDPDPVAPMYWMSSNQREPDQR